METWLRRRLLLTFAASLAELFCGAEGAVAVLGVAPEDQGKYSGTEFRCFNGQGAGPLPAAAINDEFCDCADGSDEPGTGACAGQLTTVFFCGNEGSTPRRIYASRVGDGICDCCDGSDEASLSQRSTKTKARAGCPNTCAKEGLQEQARVKKRIEVLTRALALQEEVKTKASKDHKNYRAEINKLQGELPALETALKEATARADVERQEQKAREEELRAKEEAEYTGLEACMWRQTGGCSASGAREAKQDKKCSEVIAKGSSGYCDCDGDGQKGEKEPGYDCAGEERRCRPACWAATKEGSAASEPAAVAAAAPGGEAVDEKKQVSEYAKWMEGASDTLPSDSEAEKAEESEKPQVSEYAKWMDGGEEKLQKTESDGEKSKEKEEKAAAAAAADMPAAGEPAAAQQRSAIDEEKEARSKVDAHNKKVGDLEDKLEAVPKEQLGYASLEGKTLSKRVSEFNYKITFFGSSTQDGTSLGEWKAWTGPRSATFDKGTMCWGGPERSLNVRFQCGVEEALEDAFEPSRCVYEALVTHPGACEASELEVLKSGTRVIGPHEEL